MLSQKSVLPRQSIVSTLSKRVCSTQNQREAPCARLLGNGQGRRSLAGAPEDAGQNLTLPGPCGPGATAPGLTGLVSEVGGCMQRVFSRLVSMGKLGDHYSQIL